MEKEEKNNKNLITRDKGGGESESASDTGSDFLGSQLKQPESNNEIHSCFDQSQWPLVWSLQFRSVLLILPKNKMSKNI